MADELGGNPWTGPLGKPIEGLLKNRSATRAGVRNVEGSAALAARVHWMHQLSTAVQQANEAGLLGIRITGLRFREDGAMEVDTVQLPALSICEGEGR